MVGSSRNSTSGSCNMHAASSQRIRWPSDRAEHTGWSNRSPASSRSAGSSPMRRCPRRVGRARRSRRASGTTAAASARATAASAVRTASRCGCGCGQAAAVRFHGVTPSSVAWLGRRVEDAGEDLDRRRLPRTVRPDAKGATRSPSSTMRSRSRTAAGRTAGGLPVLEGDFAGNDRGSVAVDVLHQAAAAGREVEDHLGRVQGQRVEVDQVEVGPLARLDRAAVGEAVGGGACVRVCRWTTARERQRSPAGRSRTQWVSRNVGMLASQMRPQWAPPSLRPSTVFAGGHHLPDGLVVAVDVARQRREEQRLAVALEQPVEDDLLRRRPSVRRQPAALASGGGS